MVSSRPVSPVQQEVLSSSLSGAICGTLVQLINRRPVTASGMTYRMERAREKERERACTTSVSNKQICAHVCAWQFKGD